MEIGWININNYRHFRFIFKSDADSNFVISNLEKAIKEDIEVDETAHIKLQYWVSYDDEGFAGFEVVQAKFAHNKAYINVQFTSTAK